MANTIWNGYCDLASFKVLITPPGQALTTDTVDDAVIEDMIERASRRCETLMGGRLFYPRIETLYFDVPQDRELLLEDDLLEVITLTNGDGVTISNTEYKFLPANKYPKYALYLTNISSTYFKTATGGRSEQAISLNAYWGYREQYATQGWKAAGTLGAAIADTTTLTFTMTTGHSLAAGGGQIVKIDNELFNSASSAATQLVVILRGDNGSTAATHLNGAAVYVWQQAEDITDFVLAMAHMEYKARYQPQAVESNTYMTGAGVVISPRSLPAKAQEIIDKYRRRVV